MQFRMKRVLKKSLASVSPDDRKIIRRISAYLLSHYMNEVVYEETVSDLIGMAEECKARSEDFSLVIGPDIEGFRVSFKKRTSYVVAGTCLPSFSGFYTALVCLFR